MAGIVAVALALRILFFSGYSGTDDTYYIEAAYRVSVGDRGAFDSHFAVRSGLVLSTAAVFAALGVTPLTTVLLPFACSVLGVATAFALGRQGFSTGVGLQAAVLLAVFPLDVIFASQLFACAPVGLMAGVLAWCLVRDQTAAGPWLALAAGLALGMATLAADVAWFLLLPAGYHFLARSPRRLRLLGFSLGIGAVLSLEALYYLAVAGDPWRRWHELSGALEVQGADALSSGLGISYLVQPVLRLLTEQEFGLFPYFVAVALVAEAVRPSSRHSRFFIFWVVAVFLYTSYGTTSPFRFAPLPRLPRYLSSITIPALVLLAAQLCSWRRRTRRVAVMLLVATAVACVWIDNGRAVKAPRRALSAFVAAHPNATFVLDPPLLFDVLFYRGFRKTANLSALIRDDADEALVESRRSVYGSADLVRELRDVGSAYVAVSDAAGRSLVPARCDATFVTSFSAPDRVYYRLLREPRVLWALGLTRDRHRMEGLHTLPAERVDVYAVGSSNVRRHVGESACSSMRP